MLLPQKQTITISILLLAVLACGFCPPKDAVANRQYGCLAQSKCYRPLLAQNMDREPHHPSRRRKLWRKTKKAIASVALSLSFFRTPAALAADSYDTSARANDILIESLKPGATENDAEAALDANTLVREKTDVNSMSSKKDDSRTKADKNKKKPKNTKNLYYDEDEDELDNDFFDDEEIEQLESAAKKKSAMAATTTSNVYLKSSEITTASYIKAVFIFITLPVLIFSSIETYKRRSESAYVKKALKIQAMKKQEYLNQTAAEEAARLEALKANETNTDDDEDVDEDDEDGDDDDDDEGGDDIDDSYEDPPKPPKKPSGDGGDGEGGSDGPSADDIDRLNKLLGKS